MPHLFAKALTIAFLALITAAAAAEDYRLEAAGPPPDTLAADIKASLVADGYRIAGPDDAACEVWLVKVPSVKDPFKPDLRVKYSFEAGALVGVLRIGEKGEFSDFRDQLLLPGLYTLRYAQQPQDGNHIGTSQQADFLLAVPADDDQSSAIISDKDELNALSAAAAGSSHPAIFSLLTPRDTKPAQTRLNHQPDHDFWVLETTGGDKQPALRLVVVGIGVE